MEKFARLFLIGVSLVAMPALAFSTQKVVTQKNWVCGGWTNGWEFLTPAPWVERVKSQLFTAAPPDGCAAVAWSWQEVGDQSTDPSGILKRKVAADVGATNYLWKCDSTVDAGGTTKRNEYDAVWLSVKIDYFPFTVRFEHNAQNVSGTTAALPGLYYTNTVTLTASGFRRTGYSFANWTNAIGTAFADQAQVDGKTLGVKHDKDIFLYAVWTQNVYTVNFNPGDGGTVDPQTKAVDYGSEYGELPVPERTKDAAAYVFDGWYTAESGGTRVTPESLFETAGETTLYAHWKSYYFVEFDGNGATNAERTVQKLPCGEACALSGNVYELPGYQFAGWTTNENGTVDFMDGVFVRDLALPAQTCTLRAVWTNNTYFVAFFGNGGTGTMARAAFAYDIAANLPSNRLERSASVFLGWTTDPTNEVAFADGALVSNLTVVADKIVNLYAKWTPSTPAAPSDLSEATGCSALMTTSSDSGWGTNVWTVGTGKDVDDNGKFAQFVIADSNNWQSRMSVSLKGKGTLEFWYRTEMTDNQSCLLFKSSEDASSGSLLSVGTSTMWTHAGPYEKTGDGEAEWFWLFQDQSGTGTWARAQIDGVRWIPAETNLTAQTVGVTFRRNDGTSAPDDIFDNVTKTVGMTIGELPDLTDLPLGAEAFLGWSVSADGTEPVSATWKVPAIESVQLHAVWKMKLRAKVSVPTAAKGLVYNGAAQIGVIAGAGYSICGNVATNAGDYVATATLDGWAEWSDGSTAPTDILWSIVRAKHDISSLRFPNRRFEYDGEPHAIAVVGDVPAGVTVVYRGDPTKRTEVGTNVVVASFAVADADNYEEIPDTLEAMLVITPPVPKNVAFVNRYYHATLAVLGVSIPDDASAVKAIGLPKGLKLVKFAIEGTPAEILDGETRMAYVSVTVNKITTLYPLSLKVLPHAEFETIDLPDGSLRVPYCEKKPLPLSDFWPEIGNAPANWSVSGLPAGIKLDKSAMTISGTPTKAGRFTVKAVEKIPGTSYKTTHLATLTVWPDARKGATEKITPAFESVSFSTNGVKSVSGLPSGVKFKNGIFSGTPKKAGTFVVTLTHANGTKESFLWTVTAADSPRFALELSETAVDPSTRKATLRQGVDYEWPVVTEDGAKTKVSGLPSGLKLKNGVVTGVPTKAGDFLATFKTTAKGVTTVTTYAFSVVVLPEWAVGTFNGGGNGEGGSVTLAISKVGKISGKFSLAGAVAKFAAPSFESFDAARGIFAAQLPNSGKITVFEDALGGVASNETFVAYRNIWKTEPWKTLAKAFPKAGVYTWSQGTLSAKVSAASAVFVKGAYSCSTTLIPISAVDERGNFAACFFTPWETVYVDWYEGAFSAHSPDRWDSLR